MKLKAICFAEPRVYPGGHLVGLIEGADFELAYEAGVLSVKRGAGPRRHYAVCSRDWWEEAEPANAFGLDVKREPSVDAAVAQAIDMAHADMVSGRSLATSPALDALESSVITSASKPMRRKGKP